MKNETDADALLLGLIYRLKIEGERRGLDRVVVKERVLHEQITALAAKNETWAAFAGHPVHGDSPRLSLFLSTTQGNNLIDWTGQTDERVLGQAAGGLRAMRQYQAQPLETQIVITRLARQILDAS